MHLLVAHHRQTNSTGFVTVERTRRLPAPESAGGFPVAPVARSCIDGARRLRSTGDIAELLADAVQRGMCTVGELGAELESGTRKGTGTPRKVLSGVSEGARSAAELQVQRLWPRTGLPRPWWNARVFTADGRFLGIADCWLDDVAMVWEIESTEWHLGPADHDRSVARAAAFAASGAVYIPTKPRTLRLDRMV